MAFKFIYIYIYTRTQAKYTEQWKQSSAFKQLLETLFLTIKKCTGFTIDVIWVNTKMCSVTSIPTQSSSRHISSLKDSFVLDILIYT